MKNIIITFLIVSVFLVSCDTKSNSQSTNAEQSVDRKLYTLNCNFTNSPNGKVFLEQMNGQNFVTKETIEIQDQTEFKFSGTIDEPEFYRLRFFNGKFIFLVLSANEITLSGDVNDLFTTLKVEGSDDTKAFNQFVLENSKRTTALQQMQNEYQQRAMAGDQLAQTEFQQKYAEIAVENTKFMRGVIESNLNSIIAPYLALSLDAEAEYDYMKGLSEKISANQTNKYQQQLAGMIASLKALAIGELAPELAFQNPEGEVLKLSDYKGKVVLIDFWASWCRPCRAENPNVVKMYKQFKDKGFEIYGVSLDKSKDAWVKAIENDGITWPQVSDLKFWSSDAAKLYQVSSIPQTFLIDKEGNILAKNLRGPALEAKLAEVLGE